MRCEWCKAVPAVSVVVCGNETKYTCAEDEDRLRSVVEHHGSKRKGKVRVFGVDAWERVKGSVMSGMAELSRPEGNPE